MAKQPGKKGNFKKPQTPNQTSSQNPSGQSGNQRRDLGEGTSHQVQAQNHGTQHRDVQGEGTLSGKKKRAHSKDSHSSSIRHHPAKNIREAESSDSDQEMSGNHQHSNPSKEHTWAEVVRRDRKQAQTRPTSPELTRHKHHQEPQRAWNDLELRIYKSDNRQHPLNIEEWYQVCNDLEEEAFQLMERDSYKAADHLRGDSTYYDPKLQCGVMVCRKRESFPWLKKAVKKVSEGRCRAWEQTECSATYLKIFLPKGSFRPANKIVKQILYYHPHMENKNWQILNDYNQQKTGQRIIVVEADPNSWEYIKQTGRETSEQSGMFRIDYFIKTVKVAIATPNDLRGELNHKPQIPERKQLAPKPKLPVSTIPLDAIPKPNVKSAAELSFSKPIKIHSSKLEKKMKGCNVMDEEDVPLSQTRPAEQTLQNLEDEVDMDELEGIQTDISPEDESLLDATKEDQEVFYDTQPRPIVTSLIQVKNP